MAAVFANASSQRLVNSNPSITAMPFTVGIWAYPTDNAIRTIFSLCDTAGTANFFQVGHTASQWRISANDTPSGISNTSFGAQYENNWAFFVARFISATNRWMAVLRFDGAAEHGQGTVSRTPAGLDTAAIGSLEHSAPTNFFGGNIGEYWITNTDIQEDGTQLLDSTLRQIAYGGPFSVPHIAKDIIEYRSLRKYPSSEGDDLTEVFHGALGLQTWTNTNGVTIGLHPPLPYWYEKPGQRRTPLIV